MKQILSLLVIMSLVGCTAPVEPVPPSGKIKVVASFYPLQYFSERIGGNNIEVTNLVPAGVGTHDWEPSPQDIKRIHDADVFVLNGVGEMWAENIVSSIDQSKVIIIEMTDYVELDAAEHHDEHDEHEEEHEMHDEHEEHEEHDHGEFDPHIWLDPVLVQAQAVAIKNGFAKADPANIQSYEQNAQLFINELKALDDKFRVGLSNCAQDTINTSHFAFHYPAERYGFEHVSVTGLFHEEEPSAERIAELVEVAKEHNLKYVLTETLIDPRVSETIAAEVGAETLVLNPLEGLTKQEISAGKTWSSIMEENLNNLKIALECQ